MKARTDDGYFSHSRFNGCCHSRLNKYNVSNTKPQGGSVSISLLSTCAKC